jgi:hypothetical protein
MHPIVSNQLRNAPDCIKADVTPLWTTCNGATHIILNSDRSYCGNFTIFSIFQHEQHPNRLKCYSTCVVHFYFSRCLFFIESLLSWPYLWKRGISGELIYWTRADLQLQYIISLSMFILLELRHVIQLSVI